MYFDTYFSGGASGGHYYAAQRSGEIAATLGALGHLARLRWTQATMKLVLKRIRVGISVSGAVTTAVEFNLRAIVVRNFTVDFTTAITMVNPSKARDEMPPSKMQAGGPGICTTAVLSGQTLTADAAPFAMATFPVLTPTNSTGTAVAVPVGTSVPMTTLYEQAAHGQHPVVLGQNEGIVVQPVTAGPASGTFALYCAWEWAEVLSY